MRLLAPGLAVLVWLALASAPAEAQRGAAYCNVTEVKSEQLSNGVRVTIVCDGEVQWDLDVARLIAEGALTCEPSPWGGINCMPSDRFTRLALRLFNGRSKLGSAFVPVSKYPVSHVEISIPPWASEGVGLEVDVVNYLGWVAGVGETTRFRYDFDLLTTEDQRSIVITWVSDRFPAPPPLPAPADLPSEISVAAGPAGLEVLAVNAEVRDVTNAIARETGLRISTPADSELRVSLCLHGVEPAEAVAAIAVGCGLCAHPQPDGSWLLATGLDKPGGYSASTTRHIKLSHVRAREALDLLPNFLLDYIHADQEGNAIIVTGPAALCDRVAADLAKLDAPPPEVLLDVVAVESTSARDLARALQLRRGADDLAAGFDSTTGDLSVLWLPEVSGGWEAWLGSRDLRSAARLYSRARLRVLNGRTGRVFAGQQRTIVIEEIGEGLTGRLETVDVGASLDLQPWIGRGDEVMLAIRSEVSNLAGTDPVSGLPILSRRRANAVARVRDGETIAIAGLHMDERTRQVRAMPALSRLSLAGGAFESPGGLESDTELALFITPRIIRTPLAREGASTHG